MDYDQRQKQPIVVPPDLAHDLWSVVKGMRDEMSNLARMASVREAELSDLLGRLKANGGADHLPTIEEVQKDFRGE